MGIRDSRAQRARDAALQLYLDDYLTITQVAEETGLQRQYLNTFYNGFLFGKQEASLTNEKIAKSFATRENTIFKNQYMTTIRKREINAVLREQGFFNVFVSQYVIPKVEKITINVNKEKRQKDGKITFILGDTHYIDKERSEGDVLYIEQLILNNYDNEKEIHLVFSGDNIEGVKHVSEQIAKTNSAMNQVVEVSRLYSHVVSKIKEKTNAKIFLYFIKGNHEYVNFLRVGNRDDAQENLIFIIRSLMVAALSGNKDIVFVEQESYEELFIDNLHIQHGDLLGRQQFIPYMQTKILQQKEKFKNTNIFIKGHSHKKGWEQPKGQENEFINIPALKSWQSSWENDNNQISTRGALMIKNKEPRFIK